MVLKTTTYDPEKLIKEKKMMDKQQIEILKKNLKTYVLSITQPDKKAGQNMYICPLCGSGSKSGSSSTGAFSIKGETWHCFSCNKGGDIFTLVKEFEGIKNFKDQVEKLIEKNFTTLDINKPQRTYNKAFKMEIRNYKNYIVACKANVNKTDYFYSRGFNNEIISRFNLGYDEIKDAVVIPYDNEGSYYITRSTKGKTFRKPYNDFIKEPIFNKTALSETKSCFVCESPIDAISIMSANETCNAIALGGTGYRKLIDCIKEKKPECKLILNFDNDEAGQKATTLISNELKELNILFTIATYSYDAYPEQSRKDANDLFRSNIELFQKDLLNNLEDAEKALTAEKKELIEKHNSYTALNKLKNLFEMDQAAITTGFDSLDKELDGGLYPGLYIIGSISSLGKTTLLLQLADQIINQGKDILYFSLEMATEELISKSISRYTYQLCKNTKDAKTARSIMSKSKYKNYTQTEKELINHAIEVYSQTANHLYIYEGIGNIGVEEIKHAVIEHKDVTGNIPLVFLDYLQILSPYELRASDKQNTDKAVLGLKRLSRDYQTTVIGISSFNRENYSTEVNMSAFKESGAIEYSSDVLFALQPQGMRSGNNTTDLKCNIELIKECKTSTERNVELVVLKNRNGKTGGRIKFVYHSLFNYFELSNNI